MLQSTEDLIGQVRGGSSTAFGELVRRYERAVWVTAWKVLRDYHAASDATQNTFVSVYANLSSLRVASKFGVWLMRIANREALRIARTRRTSTLALVDPFEVPERAYLSEEDHELIDAVSSLPEHERLVIVLRYFNGHSMDEIARLLGRPSGTVSKQISRAIARLKIQFKGVSK